MVELHLFPHCSRDIIVGLIVIHKLGFEDQVITTSQELYRIDHLNRHRKEILGKGKS